MGMPMISSDNNLQRQHMSRFTMKVAIALLACVVAANAASMEQMQQIQCMMGHVLAKEFLFHDENAQNLAKQQKRSLDLEETVINDCMQNCHNIIESPVVNLQPVGLSYDFICNHACRCETKNNCAEWPHHAKLFNRKNVLALF